jgi:hypothetical protein
MLQKGPGQCATSAATAECDNSIEATDMGCNVQRHYNGRCRYVALNTGNLALTRMQLAEAAAALNLIRAKLWSVAWPGLPSIWNPKADTT